jgi:hypothetical protein
MRGVNQVVQITAINLRTIPQRLGTSLVVVVGIAGVVGVLVSVLAMSEGFRYTLATTGRPNRVIMLRSGSDAELSSGVPREQAMLLATLPGVARDAEGRPLASAELMVMVDLPRRGETNPNNVPFRGVQPSAFAIRDELTIVEGRRFERGVREVIVGRKAARQFAGLTVGSRIGFRDSDWTVVGTFQSGGDVHESEIWADAEVAMSAFPAPGLPVGHGHAHGRLGRRPGGPEGVDQPRSALLDQRAARARVLRQASPGAVEPDRHPGLRRGDLHGGRRDVRRTELHVLGDRQPPGGDRHSAGHRLRRRARGGLGDDRGTAARAAGRCRRCSAGLSLL